VWHARVEERLAWHESLRVVNVWGAARIGRDWQTLPPAEPPPGLDLSQHPYAIDLDLFGRASIAQWLGPAATVGGRQTLAHWLLNPADQSEIRRRQQAVDELALQDDWREHMAARGVLAAGAGATHIDEFLKWAERDNTLGRMLPALTAATVVITAAIWFFLALFFLDLTDAAYWLLPVLVGIVLSFGFAQPLTVAFERAGGGQQALRRYAGIFEQAVTAPASAPLLAELRDRLSADGVLAPACMRRLNNILGFAELRRGAAIFHFPIQALTLWDFWVFFALERWRRSAGRRVRFWLDAVATLDALSLLATARRDNPDWCRPEVSTPPIIEAAALGHPLIPDDKRVPNDASVGPPGTVLLITGSNMSGKSTLLRSIGLNIVLAQAGGPVCAARFRLPESDLQTSIRIQDSLELGLSYFMAALARLKGVVDAAEHERPGRLLVYLLDEILQGTNSVERSLAVRAVVRHLLEAGAIGAMTTHDLSLADEEPLKSAAQLVHFTETVDEQGRMRFDYHLKPGLATSRNALRLMQMIGIDV
jgi:MutS-like protein